MEVYNNANLSGTTISLGSLWSYPKRMCVRELSDCIEMIYKETSMLTLTIHPSPPPQERVFKIVYSCIDGKWNKSQPIYGKIIAPQEESYEFDGDK